MRLLVPGCVAEAEKVYEGSHRTIYSLIRCGTQC